MTTIAESVDRYYKPIILSLMALILVILVSCAFNDAIPICHYVFGCDHGFHNVT